MSLFNYSIKITAQIFFVIIFFSTLHSKNIDKFDESNHISNYFSGILLLHENQYTESYKFLKKLNGLEESHINYSSKYLYSLINLKKFEEAFNYAKNLEKKNLDSFESDLIIGIYYLKKRQFDIAQKYFLKLKKRKSTFVLNTFLSDSLYNWSKFNDLDFQSAQNKIEATDPKFESLKNIQNVFLHCFYKSEKTDIFYKELTSNTKIDFSRYSYFYSVFLVNSGKVKKAKQVINSSLDLYPTNLLLNQYKFNLQKEERESNFDCQDQLHVTAEILYISANALSAQSIYGLSNFYLNLAKYLNENFYSFNTLLAENYYKTKNYKQAIKIYNEIKKHGHIFLWHAAKKNSIILIKEKRKEKALKLMKNTYEKLPQKNIYEIFDYADFLKNNDKFEESIKLYSKIIGEIKKDHYLYSKVLDGRGVAYERIGQWDKAEKDLLSSLNAKPNQAYVINYLAYSWIEKGIKIEESLKMLEKANDIKSNDPYIIDSLGWALFKLKKYKDAKNYLQSAVKLMPADPTVNDHFGDVLWKNGNKIQARYYWNYVLNLKDTKKELRDNIKNKLISGL